MKRKSALPASSWMAGQSFGGRVAADVAAPIAITTDQIDVIDPITRARTPMFVAHGPDGHTWMLKRLTKEAALADGLAYFKATRVLHKGRWYLSDEHGKPFADANGKRFAEGT